MPAHDSHGMGVRRSRRGREEVTRESLATLALSSHLGQPIRVGPVTVDWSPGPRLCNVHLRGQWALGTPSIGSGGSRLARR